MKTAAVPALVEPEWLNSTLGREDVCIVDATFHLPGTGRDAGEEYRARHIPGAVFFDIDDICDHANPLPHMLPDSATMAAKAGALGLADESHIVVYDAFGLMSAARVWWTLRTFGHHRVSLLDGGLPRWLREGRRIASGEESPPPRTFTPRLESRAVRSLEQVLANLKSRTEVVVDARSRGRFLGVDPEPRAGLRGGHIPGSRTLPSTELVNPVTGVVLEPSAIRRCFEQAGVDLAQPVICTCGSGVTACVLAFGLHLLDKHDVAVYDGSWSEWGGREDVPVATGD